MSAPQITSPWMTVDEAAEYLRCSVKTIRRALDDKRLIGYQSTRKGTWRIHRDDVDEFVRTPASRRRRPHTRNLRSTR
ncbi:MULTISPECIES: helix-turn-helix domain-containing protein [Rhodococcus]|uniref:helix-turn-helix domain-containing protein n=1 Tax=Rhodococcus TaxID=1827 RepID=UPI000C79BF93|nr:MULTISPECIES: helix-turn-helix domain-containing protein [Rhodococcus]AUM16488.1 hypothetical protein CSW53_08090 [Rhodococcus ruber]